MDFLTITICIMLVLVAATFIGCIIGINRADKEREAHYALMTEVYKTRRNATLCKNL